MTEFNISISFGKAMGTVVCYSKSDIDIMRLQGIVNTIVQRMCATNQIGSHSPKDVLQVIAKQTERMYGDMQTVVVPTHAMLVIHPIGSGPRDTMETDLSSQN